MLGKNYLENPYNALGEVPAFALDTTFNPGDILPLPQVSGIMGAGGKDISPRMSWHGFPVDTKSFVVTMFDPDAPTAAGFWHWIVVNIPADCNSLLENAGSFEENLLPKEAIAVKNDAGLPQYVGAAPPIGHGAHRYFLGVHALKLATLEVSNNTTAAQIGFNLFEHSIARATTFALYER